MKGHKNQQRDSFIEDCQLFQTLFLRHGAEASNCYVERSNEEQEIFRDIDGISRYEDEYKIFLDRLYATLVIERDCKGK